jgi:hypothetical protein
VLTAYPYGGRLGELKVPSDLEHACLPISVAIGDHDELMGINAVREMKSCLKKNIEQIYEDRTHGFVVRGDPWDPKQQEFSVQAKTQVLGWFRKWLGEGE